MNTRRAKLKLLMQGVDISIDIAPFLSSFTFEDNGNGKADNISLTLSDREGKWRGPWFPERGNRIDASIIVQNWHSEGDEYTLPCGTFDIDAISNSGPPDTVQIQAISLPGSSPLKNENKTKSWENVTLSQIATSISSSASMKLMFQTEDINFDRIDQTEETDLSFLARVCTSEGVMLKVTNDTIVIYDEKQLENMNVVTKLTRGSSEIEGYSFNVSSVGVTYATCEITYTDSSSGRIIRGSFTAPGVTGSTLRINERVTSEAEAIRKARNALRNKNKNAQTASFTLVGNPNLAQGVTVEVSGFGRFDDKYFVDVCRHEISGEGYRTSLEMRKVLDY